MHDSNLKMKLTKLTSSFTSQSIEAFKSRISEKLEFFQNIDEILYDSIGYEIQIDRISIAYIISHYIPVTFFTWASFSSFELRMSVGGNRIGFIVVLFMVLVSMIMNQTDRSPGGNIITSIGQLLQQSL